MTKPKEMLKAGKYSCRKYQGSERKKKLSTQEVDATSPDFYPGCSFTNIHIPREKLPCTLAQERLGPIPQQELTIRLTAAILKAPIHAKIAVQATSTLPFPGNEIPCPSAAFSSRLILHSPGSRVGRLSHATARLCRALSIYRLVQPTRLSSAFLRLPSTLKLQCRLTPRSLRDFETRRTVTPTLSELPALREL